MIEVQVFGSPAAWQNVHSIEIHGKQAELPGVFAPQAKYQQIAVFLCTGDREKFLSTETLEIKVIDVAGRVIESTVDRFACRLAEESGYWEYVRIELQRDGSILSEYGESVTGPWTACSRPLPSWVCPIDEY